MTLGGLVLVVGILVDDATVEIENIHRQMALGKRIQEAMLDGAREIALPAMISTLCICIVFVPMFFLIGVSRYLFVPLAEAVVFAMLASYVLSRTLIPAMAQRPLQHGYAPSWPCTAGLSAPSPVSMNVIADFSGLSWPIVSKLAPHRRDQAAHGDPDLCTGQRL